jgi:hypothetical protein
MTLRVQHTALGQGVSGSIDTDREMEIVLEALAHNKLTIYPAAPTCPMNINAGANVYLMAINGVTRTDPRIGDIIGWFEPRPVPSLDTTQDGA